MESIVRHTKDSKGDCNISLFAILNMAVNSKLLSFEALALSAIPKDRDPSAHLYPGLLKGLKTQQLRQLLVDAFGGVEQAIDEERLLGVT